MLIGRLWKQRKVDGSRWHGGPRLKGVAGEEEDGFKVRAEQSGCFIYFFK